MEIYFVYITTNFQKTVLYIGITNNLPRRLDEHFQESKNNKKSFAGKYYCYHLVYYEKFQNPSEAILREKTIKKWRREKKEKLIQGFNPDWHFLENEIL